MHGEMEGVVCRLFALCVHLHLFLRWLSCTVSASSCGTINWGSRNSKKQQTNEKDAGYSIIARKVGKKVFRDVGSPVIPSFLATGP